MKTTMRDRVLGLRKIHWVLLALSAAVALLGVFLVSLFGLPGTLAQVGEGQQDDVIFNYPYVPGGGAGGVDWDLGIDVISQHGGYDKAYTSESSNPSFGGTIPTGAEGAYLHPYGTSGYYNGGRAVPEHVVRSDDQILFAGYDIQPYMDYVFTDEYDIDGLSFIMRPIQMVFHTFYETGFLFNGTMSNGRYTGYAMVLSCSNTEGMLETGTASLRLYYINDEEWNTTRFKPGNTTNTRTHIATYLEGIQNKTSPSFRISMEYSDDGTIKIYIEGTLRTTIPAGQIQSTGTGFGFYTGYYSHNCSILTVVSYSDIHIDGFVPLPPIPTKGTVKFIDVETNQPIRDPETSPADSLSGQTYRIVQPQRIYANGGAYELLSNSRGRDIDRDIDPLTYYRSEAANETILYYAGGGAMPADKNARVNNSVWDPGTDAVPVPVRAGDTIDYRIRTQVADLRVPMLRSSSGYGTSATTVDFSAVNQTVRREMVLTGAFVNLDKNYMTLSEFQEDFPDGSYYNGEKIVMSCDATENTANATSFAYKKVYMWATENTAHPGFYNLYAGGQGGVWLSSATVAAGNYQFSNFTNLESLDLTNLHTEKATNMGYMFYNCEKLANVDFSGFKTEKVTTM
ncbi:MAG: hypothetical protein LBT21_07435, partial [Oscillospiraceae bacterium]|nr:hypothetical protein [Oscillospiraceae bacterium]